MRDAEKEYSVAANDRFHRDRRSNLQHDDRTRRSIAKHGFRNDEHGWAKMTKGNNLTYVKFL